MLIVDKGLSNLLDLFIGVEYVVKILGIVIFRSIRF